MATKPKKMSSSQRNFNLYRLSGMLATLRNISKSMLEDERRETFKIINDLEYLRDAYKARTNHTLLEVKNVKTTTNNKPK